MYFRSLLLIILKVVLVFGGRNFHLGRSKGGNLGSPTNLELSDLPKPQWFKQKLDHFLPSDLRHWKQRYYINDAFYNFDNPGPIFLMVGGEGPADPKWMVTGAWIGYAKHFKALCICLEHRYYGESHPTENMSTKNLMYLSSHQALADLANFITAMNDIFKFTSDVKWVAFGGSYPGSLAAWLRLKYPHLVFAAVSSSGPLLAKVNFVGYGNRFQNCDVVFLQSFKMETGFTKADNRNLPRVDMFMICNFFTSNSDFWDAEFRNMKTSVESLVVAGGDWLRMENCDMPWERPMSSSVRISADDDDNVFSEYFEVVVNALKEKTGTDECVEQIKLAHRQTALLVKSNPKLVEKDFRVCQPFASATSDDMRNFFNSIADDFADLVQYNEDNRIGLNENYRNITINSVCDMIVFNETKPAYKKLAAFNSIMLDKNKQKCMDYSYVNMISELKNVSFGLDSGRAWMYQTCTEFGFYQTSMGAADVFGNSFDLDFFIQQCKDVFGTKYSLDFIKSAADWTNSAYGALDIDVTNVVFVHGTIDPWHALGLTRGHTGSPAIYINGTAHCANMYPPSDRDSTALRQARYNVLQYLSNWLNMPVSLVKKKKRTYHL